LYVKHIDNISAPHGCSDVALQGPRNCLGQHLALLEARVVLALLQQRFNFKLASKLADPGQRHPTVIPVASIDGLPVTIE
jgi:cytochrome P450